MRKSRSKENKKSFDILGLLKKRVQLVDIAIYPIPILILAMLAIFVAKIIPVISGDNTSEIASVDETEVTTGFTIETTTVTLKEYVTDSPLDEMKLGYDLVNEFNLRKEGSKSIILNQVGSKANEVLPYTSEQEQQLSDMSDVNVSSLDPSDLFDYIDNLENVYKSTKNPTVAYLLGDAYMGLYDSMPSNEMLYLDKSESYYNESIQHSATPEAHIFTRLCTLYTKKSFLEAYLDDDDVYVHILAYAELFNDLNEGSDDNSVFSNSGFAFQNLYRLEENYMLAYYFKEEALEQYQLIPPESFYYSIAHKNMEALEH